MGKTFGTPFKKGNKGGPGRKPLTDEQILVRDKLKTEHGKLTIAKHLFGNYSDLKKTITDGKLGKTPVLDLLVARVIERGISRADVKVLDVLFDRLGWFGDDQNMEQKINICYSVLEKKTIEG